MIQSIEGIYKDGKVELLEPAPSAGQSRVIVTFIPTGTVDLPARQISPQHAADLRTRLKAFEEDWNRPEMDAYDAL